MVNRDTFPTHFRVSRFRTYFPYSRKELSSLPPTKVTKTGDLHLKGLFKCITFSIFQHFGGEFLSESLVLRFVGVN